MGLTMEYDINNIYHACLLDFIIKRSVTYCLSGKYIQNIDR